MSTKLFNTAAADPASEEEAIEIETIAGNDEEENAAVANDTESNVSSDAAANDAGQQRTRFVSKCGLRFAVGVLAVALIGAGSVHLAGRPTMNFSSSKQVAVASGTIKIKRFTFVGEGICHDGSGDSYDFVRYDDIAGAKECAKKCSKCPGGGQKGDINGVKFVFRGFEYYDGSYCDCLVDNGATFTASVCKDAIFASLKSSGSGEIKSVYGISGVECWKINSKSSKSP